MYMYIIYIYMDIINGKDEQSDEGIHREGS